MFFAVQLHSYECKVDQNPVLVRVGEGRREGRKEGKGEASEGGMEREEEEGGGADRITKNKQIF